MNAFDIAISLMAVHITILFYLVYIAAKRGGLFPFKLTFYYALIHIVGIFFLAMSRMGLMAFEVELIFKFMLFCLIHDFAEKAKEIKSVKCFCNGMLASMGPLFLLYIAYAFSPTDRIYDISVLVFNSSTILINIYVIYTLLGVIDGTRSNRVHSRISGLFSRWIHAFSVRLESIKKAMASPQESK